MIEHGDLIWRAFGMAILFAAVAIIAAGIIKLMVKESVAMTFFVLFFMYLLRYMSKHKVNSYPEDSKIRKIAAHIL